MRRFLLAAAVLGAGAAAGCAGFLDRLAAGSTATQGSSSSLDERTVAQGLREALRVGAERAVAAASRTDGFLENELIRIAVPDELRTMTQALRKLGLGDRVDELEVA
ncbi:MAG: DUF4197 family protein, partial [Acidobacteria bacterium]